MKKHDFYRLTLLGLTSGMILSQTEVNAFEDIRSLNAQHLLAKPSCKATEGCGAEFSDDDDQDDEEEDDDDDDEDDKKDTKVKKTETKKNKVPDLNLKDKQKKTA